MLVYFAVSLWLCSWNKCKVLTMVLRDVIVVLPAVLRNVIVVLHMVLRDVIVVSSRTTDRSIVLWYIAE